MIGKGRGVTHRVRGNGGTSKDQEGGGFERSKAMQKANVVFLIVN